MSITSGTFFTVCPCNCYSTCSLKVEVDNGKIIRIEGNPDNKATPEGPCLKGLSYIERIYSPERIVTPLRKRKDSGKFEKISWDTALNIISDKLFYLKKYYGAQSVFYYSGSGAKGLLNGIGHQFWRLYGGYTTTYGDLCWPAGLEATRLTLGANKHNDPWDMVNSKLIIIWGKNSSETNIHQTLFINQALEKGARLVVIDPRRTQTSERAEILLQPRPGTDGALALSIANILIKKNLVDMNFINKYVHGFPQFNEMVKEWTAEKASSITDISIKYINYLAELIGTIKPMMICAGFGMQRYTNSGQTMRAIITLPCITGNIGKPGSGWMFANLQSHIFEKIIDLIDFYPPAKSDGIVRVSISTAKLGRDMLTQNDPPLKMIWVERGNPLTSNPETPTILNAFRNLGFRVVVDQFLTDSAKEADIILPSKTLFEQSDIATAYWHPYIQYIQKIMDPPGEVKPESEIYYLLAKRLGYRDEDIARYIPDPSASGNEKYLNSILSNVNGITLAQIKEKPGLSPDHQEVAFSDFIFPTPSGKIELLSEEAQKRWNVDPLPKYSEPIESSRSDSNLSKKYPLYLLTPNTKNRIHSQFGNLRLIKAVSPEPLVTIHPEDATKRAIHDGDTVLVFNERGKIKIKARVDFGIKPGCVSITNGWWKQEGLFVNDLSLGRETDMGYGAAFHDNLVEVERISK